MTKSALIYEIPKFERSKMGKRGSIDLTNHFNQAVSSRLSDRECFRLQRLPSFPSGAQESGGGRLPSLAQNDRHPL